ncbi:hypothetical protein [Nannocystis pusilla]|uniref:hypothetical protein n=1 Tax=Nannocystis pusilla TaxID=889268 RepID=UPI003DA5125D
MAPVRRVTVGEQHLLGAADVEVVHALARDLRHRVERPRVGDRDLHARLHRDRGEAEVQPREPAHPRVLDPAQGDRRPRVILVVAPERVDVDAQVLDPDLGHQPLAVGLVYVGLRQRAVEVVEQRRVDRQRRPFDRQDLPLEHQRLRIDRPRPVVAGPAVVDRRQPRVGAGVHDHHVLADGVERRIGDLEGPRADRHEIADDVAARVRQLGLPPVVGPAAHHQHRPLVRLVADRPQDRAGGRIVAVAGAAQHHPAVLQPHGAVDLVLPRRQQQRAAQPVDPERQRPELVDRLLQALGVVAGHGADAEHHRDVGDRRLAAVIAGPAEVGDPVALVVGDVGQRVALDRDDLRRSSSPAAAPAAAGTGPRRWCRRRRCCRSPRSHRRGRVSGLRW